MSGDLSSGSEGYESEPRADGDRVLLKGESLVGLQWMVIGYMLVLASLRS